VITLAALGSVPQVRLIGWLRVPVFKVLSVLASKIFVKTDTDTHSDTLENELNSTSRERVCECAARMS
jgi:hypothetical protein